MEEYTSTITYNDAALCNINRITTIFSLSRVPKPFLSFQLSLSKLPLHSRCFLTSSGTTILKVEATGVMYVNLVLLHLKKTKTISSLSKFPRPMNLSYFLLPWDNFLLSSPKFSTAFWHLVVQNIEGSGACKEVIISNNDRISKSLLLAFENFFNKAYMIHLSYTCCHKKIKEM
jgi:hypothetical protein